MVLAFSKCNKNNKRPFSCVKKETILKKERKIPLNYI
jgi:hypothetical protein